jgi:hypothetical protein
MSLTMTLAILAGLVLVAVIVQGLWSARRAGPRRALDDDVAGAPGGGSRVEPSMDGAAPAAASSEAAVSQPAGEAVAAPVDLLLQPPRPLPRRTARLDALIDAIAPLSLDTPVTGELALMHMPPSRRVGSKPFHLEGLNAGSGDWEQPLPGQRYTEFQAGVQMANRHGPLNEIEYSEFVQKVQAFAESVGAMADFPDMLDVVARSRELDAFAGAHDAMIGVHLRAREAAWSVGYIHQCALRHGMLPGAVPGRLVLPAAEEGAPPVLVLAFDSQAALAEDPNEAAVRDLVLSLDVPQTEETAEPFAAWQQTARALAEDMDAALVDDQGRPLTLHQFAAIGEDLKQLYVTLQERDLTAGSAVARRLFS